MGFRYLAVTVCSLPKNLCLLNESGAKVVSSGNSLDFFLEKSVTRPHNSITSFPKARNSNA